VSTKSQIDYLEKENDNDNGGGNLLILIQVDKIQKFAWPFKLITIPLIIILSLILLTKTHQM